MSHPKRMVGLVVLVLGAVVMAGVLLYAGELLETQAQEPTRADEQSLASSTLPVRYRFTGVSDDGQQGSAERKEATSIHCTNTSTENNRVEVQIYQWNGTDVFTATINMPPNRNFTFSTQNTTIYFDDVLLGGAPGTPAIFQGSGVVLAESAAIICTAQVLDPRNYPPIFATRLAMYYADGTPVGDDRELFLPLILRP